MALQPAAGVRDRNPGEVSGNRLLGERLAAVYRLWGYQEVAPPSIERLDTLAAGGGIASEDLVRLASEEPLGLRPEMTASIARAAATRLLERPRPLRLWAMGSVFLSQRGDTGGQRIDEHLQSGVELLGASTPAADGELLRLLLAAAAALQLPERCCPRLLVGHHAILNALLARVPAALRPSARRALTGFDPLALDRLGLNADLAGELKTWLRLRGRAAAVLPQLQALLGPLPSLRELERTLAIVAPVAERQGVQLQLDPTFQPHFDLYDGLVFKLVCQGDHAPLEIASGGRYDALVGRFLDPAHQGGAAGVGFSFQVEAVRELLAAHASEPLAMERVLVCYGHDGALASALDRLEQLHSEGQAAELCTDPLASEDEASAIAARRGCGRALWLPA